MFMELVHVPRPPLGMMDTKLLEPDPIRLSPALSAVPLLIDGDSCPMLRVPLPWPAAELISRFSPASSLIPGSR